MIFWEKYSTNQFWRCFSRWWEVKTQLFIKNCKKNNFISFLSRVRGKNWFFKNINVFLNVDSNLDISPRGWCALTPDGRCRQKILIFDPCQVFTRVRGKNYVWKNIQMIFKFRLYFGHRKRAYPHLVPTDAAKITKISFLRGWRADKWFTCTRTLYR